MPCRRAPVLLAALVWAFAAACSVGSTDPGQTKPCTSTKDCPTGQACKQQACVALPCGGLCGDDEVCVQNTCKIAEGLACAQDPGVCPNGFVCAPSGKCQRTCASDTECTAPGMKSCNVEAGFCGECTFDRDCSDPAKKFCDAKTATCVGCASSKDCFENGQGVGKYCDTQSHSCKDGCRTVNDCAPGAKACEGGSTTDVGHCIQCRPSSEVNDCINAPDLRCDPDRLSCVECLGDGDCGAQQCHLSAHQCVQCLTNDRCDKGQICNQETFTCIPGCAGGAGGPNCPEQNPTAPVCDPNRGDHGTCVRCLKDADCPRATVCDLSGPTPACVPGCNDSQTGSPSNARCTAGAQPSDVNLVCDGTKGSKGKCVQCLDNSTCPTTQVCDNGTNGTGLCRCKKEGEACNDDSECGYRVINNAPLCDHSTTYRAYCITKVRCNGSYKTVSKVCARSGSGLPEHSDPGTGTLACPSGFVTDWACNANNQCGAECVSTTNSCH